MNSIYVKCKMDTMFMNSKIIKTNLQKLVLQLKGIKTK